MLILRKLEMRVAVLSDVHANLHALESVLAQVDAGRFDAVWCLGDLVGYGPKPNECVALLQERAAMTASATAKVAKVAFDPDEESSSLDETDIDYVFVAKGQPVAASTSLPGDLVKDYPAGREIAVCYDPKEPATSRINTDGGACGG